MRVHLIDVDFRHLGCPACTLCPEGNYSDSTASTECPPCQPGSYSNMTGSTFCTGCDAGHFSERAGSAICKACPIGSHQPDKNQTTCLPCDAGHETRYIDTLCLPNYPSMVRSWWTKLDSLFLTFYHIQHKRALCMSFF